MHLDFSSKVRWQDTVGLVSERQKYHIIRSSFSMTEFGFEAEVIDSRDNQGNQETGQGDGAENDANPCAGFHLEYFC